MNQSDFAGKKRSLQRLVKILHEHIMQRQGKNSSQIEKLIRKIKKLVHELTEVLSNRELKRILGTAVIFLGISFTNTVTAQSFEAPRQNPFGLGSVYYYAIPAFADLDGDGDIDLLVGEYYGSMQYFKNTGTATNPKFDAPQALPFGLDTAYGFAFPTFADLDNDGDNDLLVGEYYGNMQYFKNTGTVTNPNFSAPQKNPFGLSTLGDFAAPEFVDLDDDGDFDLMVGAYESLEYFENTGSASNPKFAAPQSNPFGIATNEEYLFPAFADLDGDGDFDMLVGDSYGNTRYYENTGTASNPKFANPRKNAWGIKANYLACPEFADLDNDGDMDLLVGQYLGSMLYFKNNSTVGVDDFFTDSHALIYPNPVNDILHIEAISAVQSVEIFDIMGKSVVLHTDSINAISVASLHPGMFTVKVSYVDGSYSTNKFSKQ